MPPYDVVFARSARRELQVLSHSLAERILKKIEALASNPRPPGCMKLRGHPGLWRMRVGEYRVIYSIDDKKGVVDVSVVRHRDEAYD